MGKKSNKVFIQGGHIKENDYVWRSEKHCLPLYLQPSVQDTPIGLSPWHSWCCTWLGFLLLSPVVIFLFLSYLTSTVFHSVNHVFLLKQLSWFSSCLPAHFFSVSPAHEPLLDWFLNARDPSSLRFFCSLFLSELI